METTLFKAGKYYIGDPCYIFSKSWDKLIEENNFLKPSVFIIDGHKCAIGSTAYGDGIYEDNFGYDYYVDAGLIGILPIELLKLDEVYNEANIEEQPGLSVVEFSKDFKVKINDGKFKFGGIRINTQDI